ncbi:MAG: methylmalonyl Co-A mutase-associated GTPase MeaB [Saprospiraceae bacterium]|nr:methylmalonyl Co-A mutase-associated GTPase MeaB [Saprospiraceae bacterium]
MSGTSDLDQLFSDLAAGSRVALARAITLVESTRPEHRAQAAALLDRCTEITRDTFRFAVSGAPGVGKSSLIEALGKVIVADGHRLAVLAIDPSSPVSHGAILGDKTRMESLSRHPHVFIRPSAAGATLGGVADRTREVILLCEAAGYDHLCVETVGVGQSETAVERMTDFFLLLLLPGGGDDLQGIKKGIVELADLIAVTKTDGIHRDAAKETQRYYARALHYLSNRDHGIPTKVITCSAIQEQGIDKIWAAMQNFASMTRSSGYHAQHRARQNTYWFDTRARQLMYEALLQIPAVQAEFGALRARIAEQTLSVSSALRQLEQIIPNALKTS